MVSVVNMHAEGTGTTAAASAGAGTAQGLLGDLFSALVGGTVAGTTAGPTPGTAGSTDLSALLGQGVDTLDGNSTLSDAVSALTKEFNLLEKNGIDLDSIHTPQDLEKAYESLGLSADQAQGRALKTTLTLNLLKRKLQAANDPANTGMMSMTLGSLLAQNGQNLLNTQQAASVLQKNNDATASTAISSTLAARILQGEPLSTTSAAQAADAASQKAQALTGANAIAGAAAKDDVAGQKAQALASQAATPAAAAAQNTQNPFADQMAQLMGQSSGDVSDADIQKMASLASRLIGNKQTAKQTATNAAPKAGPATNQKADVKALAQSATQALARQQAQQAAQSVSKAPAVALSPAVDADKKPGSAAVGTDKAPGMAAVAKAATPQKQAARADLGVSKSAIGSDKTKVDASSQNATGQADPSQVMYVVQPAPGGGVQLVNPHTGDVVSAAAQGAQQQAAQTPAQAQMMSLAAQSRVDSQVRVYMRTLANHGGGRIEVSLSPAELGRVQVKLQIDDGVAKGTITVQRPEVAEHLARNMHTLEQALKDAGLNLAPQGMSLNVSADGSGNQQSGEQGAAGQQFSGNRMAGFTPLDGDDGNNASQAQWVDIDRVLDVNV